MPTAAARARQSASVAMRRRVAALGRERQAVAEDVEMAVAGAGRQQPRAAAGRAAGAAGRAAPRRCPQPSPPALQEVEVEALVGLQHVAVEEPGVAARRGFGRAVARGKPRGELVGVDQELEPAGGHVEADAVAGAHDRERAAGGGFRRDVQDHGAEGRAAHPGVGDAHHVLDPLPGQPARDRDVAGLGHAGRAARPGVAQDEDVVRRDRRSPRRRAAAPCPRPSRRRRRAPRAAAARARRPSA